MDKRKHRQAEQLLPQARAAGVRFSQLAARYSEDPSAKTAGGSLGLATHGQFVPQFEEAACITSSGARRSLRCGIRSASALSPRSPAYWTPSTSTASISSVASSPWTARPTTSARPCRISTVRAPAIVCL
ncbi:MAG: hypothetical protein DMD66_10170 [Gemmatimonadetes bacterium]|nr:MAG: hypothetical protein DMD66_10170 [Gemmatimonadota bacterium]